jgi:hypothetical protein
MKTNITVRRSEETDSHSPHEYYLNQNQQSSQPNHQHFLSEEDSDQQ